MPDKKEVLLFTPTPNEYQGVKRHVESRQYRNFTPRVVESGPGKINAAFKMAAEILPRLSAGFKPAFVAGVGTSGSLSLGLTSGDVIISSSCIISDWKMEDDETQRHGVYGQFVYQPLSPGMVETMVMDCDHPAVEKLVSRLSAQSFKSGRMLTGDVFVAGKNNKLSLGDKFRCLACDMESGAFAFTARNLLGGLPWFNIRVVADTLDETLSDYFNKEVDMVDILGQKTAEALTILDDVM